LTSRNKQQFNGKSLSQTTQESIVETPITAKINKKNKRLLKQALNLSLMSNNKSTTIMSSLNESLSVNNESALKLIENSFKTSLNIEDKIDSIIDTNTEQEVEEYGVQNEVVIDSNAQVFQESVQDMISITEALSDSSVHSIHESNNCIASSKDNNNSSSIMSSFTKSETISTENSNINNENKSKISSSLSSEAIIPKVKVKTTTIERVVETKKRNVKKVLNFDLISNDKTPQVIRPQNDSNHQQNHFRRSKRTLFPRLNFWCGQRPVFTRDSNGITDQFVAINKGFQEVVKERK
jgi:hypothetical protein